MRTAKDLISLYASEDVEKLVLIQKRSQGR